MNPVTWWALCRRSAHHSTSTSLSPPLSSRERDEPDDIIPSSSATRGHGVSFRPPGADGAVFSRAYTGGEPAPEHARAPVIQIAATRSPASVNGRRRIRGGALVRTAAWR